MKFLKSLYFLFIIFCIGFVFSRCGNERNDSLYNLDDDLGSVIDYYAGHPNDPDLPDYFIGATDEVIEATDLREMANMIDRCIDFALEEVEQEPRYLFALGRAAYLIGYNKKSREWLELAASNGSAAAFAYLGYIRLYEEEDIGKALECFRYAIEGGFEDGFLEEIYSTCNFDQENSTFNKKEIINAFFQENWDFLQSRSEEVLPYVARIHTTLWSDEILWLVEDPAFLLELSPEASRFGEAYWEKILDEAFGYFNQAAKAEITQDAKRLALLYNTNPVVFRKIYNGMMEFAKRQR